MYLLREVYQRVRSRQSSKFRRLLTCFRAFAKGERWWRLSRLPFLGQFNTSIEQVYGAFKQIGFADVMKVAEGAMMTISSEAHELVEKLEEGQAFMTTSCCPSYIELVEEHVFRHSSLCRLLRDRRYTMPHASRKKRKHPDAKIVFVGPCVAKRAKRFVATEAVDFILTFEEIGSYSTDWVSNLRSSTFLRLCILPYAERTVCQAVMGAVKAYLKDKPIKSTPCWVSDEQEEHCVIAGRR